MRYVLRKKYYEQNEGNQVEIKKDEEEVKSATHKIINIV